MDQVLNISFFAFHSSWILFNCLGWIWRQTRAWQLATVSLTALSWFGLGIWYGWGYCPCTEWHWQVRARLGHHDPPSYIQLMIREVFGVGLSPNTCKCPGACHADCSRWDQYPLESAGLARSTPQALVGSARKGT